MENYKKPNPWSDPIKCTGDARDTVQQIVKAVEQNYYLFGGWANVFEQVLDLTLYALERNEEGYMQTSARP